MYTCTCLRVYMYIIEYKNTCVSLYMYMFIYVPYVFIYSLVAENDARFHKRVSHRAYGPKDVHADRTLTYLHPEEFNKLRRTSRTMNKTPLPYVNNEVA